MKHQFKVKFVVFIMLILIFSSCNLKQERKADKESFQGIWIVAGYELDKGFYKPNSQILDFKSDTVYFKSFEEKIKLKKSIIITKDSVKLDSTTYSIRKFYTENNTLNFGRAIANRIVDTKQVVDIVEFEKLLSSSDWKIEDQLGVYRFNSEEKRIQLMNTNGDFSKYCYELIAYQDKVFLQNKGNQLTCDRDYQFIEQIISFNNKEIQTFGFRNGEFKTIRYQSVPKVDALKPIDFQLCNKYINKNYPHDRYYYKGTKYNGGLYNIRRIFNKNYRVPDRNKESGIFQVRFVVNCEGKAGMYETQAFDNNYKLKFFSPEIVNQILDITKSLQDWIPGKRSRSNQAIDTYIYLSFRIKDGKIIHIFP